MKINTQKLPANLPTQIVSHIQHLERMRQDFVANVSHELRTPLTVIHGYLETLLDEKDLPETRKKVFLQMHQQTLRMENLIEDLLLLSRLEDDVDNETKTDEPVAVADLLNQICNEARELSGDAKHDIQLHADKTVLLKGCQEELRSLFSNLIFNAVKYTAPNGEIIINWQMKNKKAYFSVQDSGIGIAEKHIPRLTERFYRVDPARSRSSGGTGLGLAIAKHVLLRHDGELNIQSKLGKGSTFTCIFPNNRLLIN